MHFALKAKAFIAGIMKKAPIRFRIKKNCSISTRTLEFVKKVQF